MAYNSHGGKEAEEEDDNIIGGDGDDRLIGGVGQDIFVCGEGEDSNRL